MADDITVKVGFDGTAAESGLGKLRKESDSFASQVFRSASPRGPEKIWLMMARSDRDCFVVLVEMTGFAYSLLHSVSTAACRSSMCGDGPAIRAPVIVKYWPDE